MDLTSYPGAGGSGCPMGLHNETLDFNYNQHAQPQGVFSAAVRHRTETDLEPHPPD